MKDDIKTKQKLLVELFSRAPIKKTTGMVLSYNEIDQAVFIMPYNPGLDHALHQTHGGAIATMLDNAGWFTIAPHYGTWIATAEMQMRLLEPVAEKELIAVGQVIKLGKKIAMGSMEVRTGDGTLIALGSGTFAVTNIPY